MATIFDKILDGEIPCHKVYEDEHVLAFLDVGPLSKGHTLVIPKERKAVFHVHFHIIPRAGEAGLGVGWRPGKLGNDEGAELARRVADALAG
jgi:histidine triad (HIT) family protein